MKQKIVMKVQFGTQKRRKDAFKIAAECAGVSSVTIEADKGEIEVIGEGVDSVCLATALRKKLRFVEISSIGEVKEEEKKEEKKIEVIDYTPIQYCPSSYVQYPVPYDFVYRC